ncbi:MAG: methionyl-tRNA formyltransferase [Thermodesulfobacteriota bacterium]
MRIIIVGQGPFGEKVLGALLERREDIVGVFSPPDKRGEAMKELAERSGAFFFQPAQMKDPQVYDTYWKLKPDLVILAFVTDIIPPDLLEIPSIGTICYHPSLLPRHRGASAINWAIMMGDVQTGLTIFWVDQGIDTGPILLQKEVEIGPHETTGSLYFNTLFPMGVRAVVEAVELINKGKAPRIPQDDSKATYEPPCDDRVARLDFERSVKDAYNFIRGCDPQPGAYTFFRGKKVRFYEGAMESFPIRERAGEVLSYDKERLQVAAQGGIVKIGKLRVDKDKIGPMEFAKLVDLKVGDRFGE